MMMRGSEQEAHFNRGDNPLGGSAADSSMVGGGRGGGGLIDEDGDGPSQVNDIRVNDVPLGLDDDEQQRDSASAASDDGDDVQFALQTNVGQGAERAKKTIREQMIRREKTLELDNLFLQDLYFMKNQSWHFLEEIRLTKNLINNIDTLNMYKSLRVIDASHNYIVEVNLCLPKLEQLILANNFLKKFPILENMKKLKIINLNANGLTDFKDVAPNMTPNVRRLDLGFNELKFGSTGNTSSAELADFRAKLKEFKHLRELVVQGNPFMDEASNTGAADIQKDIIKEL